jgi:hypothetical protein
MTVRGFPTQSATDVLNKLCAELFLLERRAQLLRDGAQSSINKLRSQMDQFRHLGD